MSCGLVGQVTALHLEIRSSISGNSSISGFVIHKDVKHGTTALLNFRNIQFDKMYRWLYIEEENELI